MRNNKIKRIRKLEIEKMNKIKELERIARKIEYHKLATCLNINLRIEYKKILLL